MPSCMLSSTLKEKLLAAIEIMSSAGEHGVRGCFPSPFFCSTFCGSFMLYIKVMIVTMLKMTVDINYLAHNHPCPFSEFVPFFLLTLSLLVFFPVVIKLRCSKLYCTAGASWVPASRMLAHTASILWAMQIIVYLTDVPCIFHTATWLCLQWVKSFFPFLFSTTCCFFHLPTPSTLTSYSHAHFQHLSLKSMGLILLRLMDFAAKVSRMHFNHGRS